MRIGIDARFYGPIGKGLGRYVQKLIKYLEKIDHQNDYFIFLKKENFENYQPQNPHFKKVLTDCRWYSLKEQIIIPLKVWQCKIDLMHFPHFNVAIFCPCKFIVTIHDLIVTKFPTKKATTLGPFFYKLKWIGYKIIIYWAVKRADKIITVSNFTKKELINYFKLDTNKIMVTYEAVDENKEVETNDKIFLNKLKINKPYLLYVGNAYPHKNLERLIKAFKNLLEEFHEDLQLILVGKDDYFYKQIKNYTNKLNLSEKVFFADFINDNDLSSFYKNALVYVCPSLYEGFGLPGLEAMKYGLPIVSSNVSSLPEIYGEAAVYFNPDDFKEMFQKMRQVIKNKDLRESLIKKGSEQIKKYSWLKCAEQTLEIYQKRNNEN